MVTREGTAGESAESGDATPPGDAAIRTLDLSKHYGDVRALEDLDLTVWTGEVFGYLGPNGAGKTTTIRLLLDLIRPTRGVAQVLGRNPQAESEAVRREVGYLPGEMALYENMTVKDHLAYLGHLRGGVDGAYVEDLCERLDLDRRRPVGDLSRGNKQKVGIVQAFMHRPRLLILDEPTSGLDPLVQHEFYAMVAEANAEGRTVLFSSHVLSEIERIADRVGIIREGRLVAVRDIRELKATAGRRLNIRLGQAPPSDVLDGVPGVAEYAVDDRNVTVTLSATMSEVVRTVTPYDVHDLRYESTDLERLFLRYYQQDVERVEEARPDGSA